MDADFIFSLIATAVLLGGACIAFGVMKGKINASASKDELTAAIKRSDEMLEALSKRVEDEHIGTQQWRKEFIQLTRGHGERIYAIEALQSNQSKMLDKLDATMQGGFSELRDELRELQRSIRNNG